MPTSGLPTDSSAARVGLESTVTQHPRDVICRNPSLPKDFHLLWPHVGDLGKVDTGNNTTPVTSADGGSMLDYPLGVGSCGGKYPIGKKGKHHSNSTVCVQTETSNCTYTFEIDTHTCLNNGREWYILQTNVTHSNFCFGPNYCLSSPCANGGECVAGRDGFTCKCAAGYKGPTCDGDPCTVSRPITDMQLRGPSNTDLSAWHQDSRLPPGWYDSTNTTSILTRPVSGAACGTIAPMWVKECTPIIQDGIIIEDVSASIGPHNYEKTKAFVVDTIRNISKSSKETNVALMVFSDTAEVLFHLNTYRDKKTSIMEAIDSQMHTEGNSFLGDAIKLATSEVFTETNGDRSDVPNVVLLLTDGYSDANEDVRSSIDGLKAKAEVFVVTVTDQVDNTTIDSVASSPVLTHVFHIDASETARSINDVTSGHICPKPVPYY